MRRYYFHVRNDGHFYQDGEGTNLPNPRAAWHHAISDIREIVRQKTLEGPMDAAWIDIANSSGVVASIPFAHAFKSRRFH
jgi:hypothetical protein